MAGIELPLGIDVQSFESADSKRFVADETARLNLKWIRKGEIVYQEDTGIRWEFIGTNTPGGHSLPTVGADWAVYTAGGVTSYNDLDDLPSLFDGDYNSLSSLPTLFSGAYADLSGKPTLVTTHLALTDTPATYVAKSLQATNAAGDALINTSVYYDSVNFRLGINQATPLAKLHVKGTGTTSRSNSFLTENSDGTKSFQFSDDGSILGVINNSILKVKSGAFSIQEDDASAAQYPFTIINKSNATVLKVIASNGTIYAGGLRSISGSLFRFTGSFEISGGSLSFGNTTSGNYAKDGYSSRYISTLNATSGAYSNAVNEQRFQFITYGTQSHLDDSEVIGNWQYYRSLDLNINITDSKSHRTVFNQIDLTIVDAMNRPRPLPVVFTFIAPSPRLNFLKSLCFVSSEIPIPVSLILILAKLPFFLHEIVTLPSRVYLIALSIRLDKI